MVYNNPNRPQTPPAEEKKDEGTGQEIIPAGSEGGEGTSAGTEAPQGIAGATGSPEVKQDIPPAETKVIEPPVEQTPPVVIKPEVKVTPQAPQQKAVVRTAVAPTKKAADKLIVVVPATTRISGITDRLNNYMVAMVPGVNGTPDKAGMGHDGLARAFDVLLGLENPKFDEALNLILDTFKNNLDGVFDPYITNRHINMAKLKGTQMRNYERLKWLFTLTCDPKSREIALKQVDLNEVTHGFASTPGAERLITFYKK